MEACKVLQKDIMKLTNYESHIADTFIMNMCCTEKFSNAGISFYKFLQNCYKPSIITTERFLSLYNYKNGPITEAEREYVLQVYKELRQEYKTLSGNLAEACITALCKVGEWEESIEIINTFEKEDTSEFLILGYSALIKCLLDQGNIELMFKYLIICCQKSSGLQHYVCSAYLKYCLKDKQTFNTNVEKLFSLWSKCGNVASIDTINEFIDTCNQLGWTAQITNIRSSVCMACRQKLSGPSLTEEDFNILSHSLLEKLFIDRQYQNTVPAELNNFMKFIQATKPYDVVLDVLNILCMRPQNKEYNKDALFRILEYFKKQNKKVLAIGRHHLRSLPFIQAAAKKATFFFVENVSNDDPFMLYASLTSGKNTIIVSRDFMRQHRYALHDGHLSTLFKKWQYTQQYICVLGKNGTVKLTEVHRCQSDLNYYFNSGAQKHGNSWHIPFSTTGLTKLDNVGHGNWACFRIGT
ncbi:Mitochondrial ribonuclease P protein 3 [Dufourea novaeangliae]|uniref:Mitochondrial ribonuclease P catalytic subunit n=1 Tax=Dufourea novaeangliae TaxID=178035 RepID=A0A154PNX9_DUFNO|nr:Mitochondrial ribonuclease P protein 3 [Dufourea novaeangliae]